jgi:hypothetical protein
LRNVAKTGGAASRRPISPMMKRKEKRKMKREKTTKRLAALSAALFVGSLATFGADVRACSQDVAAPTVGEAVEIGANESTPAAETKETTPDEKNDATPAVERVKELGGTLERDEAGRVVSLELNAENATVADVRLFVAVQEGKLERIVLHDVAGDGEGLAGLEKRERP